MCPQFPDTNTDTTRRLKQYPAEFNPMSRKQRQHDGTSELRRRYQLIATGQVAPSPLRRLQSTIPRTEISPTRIQLLTHPSSRTPYDGHANLATLLANYATAADTVIEALLPPRKHRHNTELKSTVTTKIRRLLPCHRPQPTVRPTSSVNFRPQTTNTTRTGGRHPLQLRTVLGPVRLLPQHSLRYYKPHQNGLSSQL